MNTEKDMRYNREIPFKINLSGDRIFKGVVMKKLFHLRIMPVLMFAFVGMLLAQNVFANEEIQNLQTQCQEDIFEEKEFKLNAGPIITKKTVKTSSRQSAASAVQSRRRCAWRWPPCSPRGKHHGCGTRPETASAISIRR